MAEKAKETLPEGKFRVIYADPPWMYDNDGLKGTASDHYFTMKPSEIEDMPVQEKAGDNSVLFLWVTSPQLEEGLEVLDSWGFEYKTSFVWVKDKSTYGKLGFYTYTQHEFLLIGVKGSCLPKEGSLEPSVISAPKGEHSEKPEKVYEIIEQMYNGPYLELFARQEREHWTAWGDEVGTQGQE
ncbi:hypothetical protein AKJ37_03175 [candidate division MSBL1 archaeon SCGC-AAA259I09]|uniref:DNA methyltransferase n=1 Tax=candidate division MSBL1 archaeon SCGC-AAA259I09 TaxID=1698267 RepID=A0A133UT01_9EURY|nr:hypothetical protein AKJ37_03175 [candidate division MSBL1 archaeon SCGC-AAA259I09]